MSDCDTVHCDDVGVILPYPILHIVKFDKKRERIASFIKYACRHSQAPPSAVIHACGALNLRQELVPVPDIKGMSAILDRAVMPVAAHCELPVRLPLR